MTGIDTILAGLLDGTSHATCKSCRAVMREAHEALRAANEREPLFEGHVEDWAVLDGEERYLGIQGHNLGSHNNPNSWPERITVYAAPDLPTISRAEQVGDDRP